MVREKNGKFVKGHDPVPGSGRKKRKTEENFLALLNRAVSEDDWIAIIMKARDQAIRGDSRAREWLADRKFGKVTDKVDLDTSGKVQVTVRYKHD